MDISWKNIDKLEDYQITYLLYKKESLDVNQIAKVRNISPQEVGEQLIKFQVENRKTANTVNEEESIKKSSKEIKSEDEELEVFLTLDKNERLDFLDRLKPEKMIYFKRTVYKRILKEYNPEDLIILIWTAGELKEEGFLKVLHTLTNHKNSDVRRITYSAIRKIGSLKSREVLELGLLDSNPQTRQYCAKALLKVGNEHSLNILRNQYRTRQGVEKDYVLRAYREAIVELEKSV